VNDIQAEWTDRYGPPPEPAKALLRVARLRAECVRTGVREVTVAKDVARLSPLALKTSQRIRLQRVARDSVYKEDLAQLVVPIRRGGDPSEVLTDLLGALVPVEAASVALTAP
jgi:transcription-repair coupling factor (superfamily II helicase)